MASNFFENFLDLFNYNPLEPMLFNSGFFLFLFFFCLLFNQFFLKNIRAKVFFLLIISLFFYYKSSGIFFLLIIISSLIDYYAGKHIHDSDSPKFKKILLVVSIITNLGILGYFKYTNFFLETLNNLSLGNFDMMDIFLPVGVSFFTFQSMSYTIDIYRGNLLPEKRFLDFLFFVSFFPQLVAGPIVRASDFLPQINSVPHITKEDIGKATFLIIGGLFKKAVIADYVSINFVDRVFEWPTRFTGVENLLAIWGYTIQLYCDFSGYSDMAIGLALYLGFKLPMNFNSPYKSASITEFWSRWHISLSTWLKDYLYISLGGNRKGNIRTYVNLLLTMLLGGLWHGASWRMAIWGFTHGAALALERLTNYPKYIGKNWFTRIIGAIITFNIFAFSLIFFRAQSYEIGTDMIHQVLYFFNGEVFVQFIDSYRTVTTLLVLAIIMHLIPKKYEIKLEQILTNMPAIGKAVLFVLVIWIVAQFKSADIQPFIYFQF